jgi:hypothetical protein
MKKKNWHFSKIGRLKSAILINAAILSFIRGFIKKSSSMIFSILRLKKSQNCL